MAGLVKMFTARKAKQKSRYGSNDRMAHFIWLKTVLLQNLMNNKYYDHLTRITLTYYHSNSYKCIVWLITTIRRKDHQSCSWMCLNKTILRQATLNLVTGMSQEPHHMHLFGLTKSGFQQLEHMKRTWKILCINGHRCTVYNKDIAIGLGTSEWQLRKTL